MTVASMAAADPPGPRSDAGEPVVGVGAPVAGAGRPGSGAPVASAGRPDGGVPDGGESVAGAGRPESGAPGPVERAHLWAVRHWPKTLRNRVAVVALAVIALGFVVIATFGRLVNLAVSLDLLAYVGLMVFCWVGAGGALVPIPGVRELSWIMVVNQGAALDPVLVALLAALAMGLGQSSYFLATREGVHHVAGHRGRHAHADGAAGPPSGDVAGGGEPPSAAPARVRPWSGIVARSRTLLERGKDAVTRLMHVHPQRTIFILSVVPNPLTTFATVTAAALGVRYPRFFAASLAGFILLTSILVIAGQGIIAALGIHG